MRGRAALGLAGIVVAGGASAAVLLTGAVGVPRGLLSDLPFGLGGGGTPASVAAQEGPKPTHARQAAGAPPPSRPLLPPLIAVVTPNGAPGSAVAGVGEPSPVTAPTTPTPPTPPPVRHEPPPPSPQPPPLPPPAPTPPPDQPSPPPGGTTGSGSAAGSSGGSSGSTGGSSGPPPPPPPPPPPVQCTIRAGVITVSNATAHSSALLSGCSTTDVRLTLAAYRRGASSFVLLASATAHPVPDGTALQELQLPACSTDVVLIRGNASASISSFSVLLAHTAAPGCGGTSPPPSPGDPAAPPPGGDGASGLGSTDSGDGSESGSSQTGGDGGGDQPTGDGSSQTQTGTGDSGSSQKTDSGSTNSPSGGTQGATGSGEGSMGGSGRDATSPQPGTRDKPRVTGQHS